MFIYNMNILVNNFNRESTDMTLLQ